jgi:hypothetical protein
MYKIKAKNLDAAQTSAVQQKELVAQQTKAAVSARGSSNLPVPRGQEICRSTLSHHASADRQQLGPKR